MASKKRMTIDTEFVMNSCPPKQQILKKLAGMHFIVKRKRKLFYVLVLRLLKIIMAVPACRLLERKSVQKHFLIHKIQFVKKKEEKPTTTHC